MAGVTVALGNGSLGGAIASADGAMGIIMTGATEGTATAGTPFLVTNEAEITALALTTGNNPLAVKFFTNFLAETKLLGVNQFELYVILVTTATKVNTMCSSSNANGVVKLINFANGKIKIVAAVSNDTLVYPGGTGLTTTAGINADCYTAITNLQATLASYAALPYNWPMRGIVGCTSFTGTASDLTDITANTTNRVMAFIGDTASGDGCAMGLVMGRLAAIPVQRKISRVKDGPVSSTTAYIATTAAESYASTTTITGKGFNTFKTITNKNGYYFTGDQTACATTDDYHFMCRGRVIDKAHRIIVEVYNNEIDDEVDTNDDGTIDANSAKSLEAKAETAGKTNMVALDNCKEFNVTVDPDQNVDATSTIGINANVKGKGYSTTFNVNLGFKPTT